MATYAIGDIQGCFDQLQALLDKIEFRRERDRLWFAGDLVNRGPKSLETLRFIRDLGDAAVAVLGNHDLHLLAVAGGHVQPRRRDHLDDVLQAPDREALLEWLRHCPLLHHDAGSGYTLVHAGLPPQWDLQQAQACAQEVETTLHGTDCQAFFAHMYGNEPDQWSESLRGWERLRFITNCLTRLRYCDLDGRLHLGASGPPGSQPPGYLPWFEVPGRASASMHIVFGHWSTLGPRNDPGIYPLDTGCVWGAQLTALRLEDRRLFSVPCPADLVPPER